MFNFIFALINRFLDGKKRILSGIGALGGFLTIVSVRLGDGLQQGDLAPIFISFSLMMGIFGFSHAIEKIHNTLKALLGNA